jgi:hypothetical protein
MAQLITDASSGVIQAFVADQRIRAYRIDNQRLTENDWQQVFTCFRTIEPPSEPMPIPVPMTRSEIKAEKKPDKVKTKKWTRLPPSPESKDPGVATGDVFRIFGNSARTILTEEDWLEIPETDRQAILREASRWVRVNGRWHQLEDIPRRKTVEK